MDRQNFYFGKLVDVPEMRDLQNNIENGINFIKAMLGKGIWKGGNLVIANLNLTIDDTVCFDNVGNTIFIGSQVFNMANFIPPTDKKIVSITASFTRNYSQAEQDDLGNNVYFQEDEGCQINYIESDVTESPAVSIIPDSQVLIADVTLTAGQTEIITENISFDRIKRLDQFGRKLIDVFSYIENHSALHEDLFYNKPTLDNAFSSYLKKNANLSDLINKSVARDNLGVPAIGQTMLRFITNPTLRKDVQWVENIDTIRTTGFFSTGALDDATWVIIHMERNGRGVQLRIGSGLNTGLIEIRNRNGDINNTTWENWIGLAKTSEVNNKISKVPSIETIDDTGMEDGTVLTVDVTNKKIKKIGNVKIDTNTGNVSIGTSFADRKLCVRDPLLTSTTIGENIVQVIGVSTSGADVTLLFTDGITYFNTISMKQGNLILAPLLGYIFFPQTYNNTTANASNMYIGTDGMLYRSTSTEKYKTQIEPIGKEYIDKILQIDGIWYRSLTRKIHQCFLELT